MEDVKYVIEVNSTSKGVSGRCFYSTNGEEHLLPNIDGCFLIMTAGSKILFSMSGKDASLLPAIASALNNDAFRDILIKAITFNLIMQGGEVNDCKDGNRDGRMGKS